MEKRQKRSPTATLPEIRELLAWLGNPPRHPRQTHGLNESDSEVIHLGPNRFLAATIDSVAEEILFGLYRDPYTMGWVAAMATLSDLAAVGAAPIGVLFSTQWGGEIPISLRRGVARGLHDALKKSGTHLLGGDSGSARSTVLTTVGLGLINGKPLSRMGLKAGNVLCLTGKLGIGPAHGFQLLFGAEPELLQEKDFRPVAQLKAGNALRTKASAAIDLSDGFAAGLHQLLTLNDVGAELEWRDDALDPRAVKFCMRKGLPSSMLWFGEHGDFQLLFGVPESRLRALRAKLPGLLPIGRVVPKRQGTSVRLPSGKRVSIQLDVMAEWPRGTLQEFDDAVRHLARYLAARGLP